MARKTTKRQQEAEARKQAAREGLLALADRQQSDELMHVRMKLNAYAEWASALFSDSPELSAAEALFRHAFQMVDEASGLLNEWSQIEEAKANPDDDLPP